MSVLSDVVSVNSRIGASFGIAIVILGTLAIMAPHISGLAVTVSLGILMLAAGIMLTVYAFKANGFGSVLLQALFGGLTSFCGVCIIASPGIGLLSLTSILIAYFIVDGCFAIYMGFKGSSEKGWGWILFSGAVSIILAVMLWREWPASSIFAVGILVGVRLIFAGWAIAMLGFVGDAAAETSDEDIEQAINNAADSLARE